MRSVVPARARASLARKCSPLFFPTPTPSTSGEPKRAPHRRCGSALANTAIAYAPWKRAAAARTASNRSQQSG